MHHVPRPSAASHRWHDVGRGQNLVLTTTEYAYERESGSWTADSKEFRYQRQGGAPERCNMSITGRTLVLTGCRFAGRYTRQN